MKKHELPVIQYRQSITKEMTEMKRMFALLLTLALTLFPCLAQAQTADSSVDYTLDEAGISLQVPDSWLTLIRGAEEESLLALLMGMTQTDVDEFLIASDFYLYAIPDLFIGDVFAIGAKEGLKDVDLSDPFDSFDLTLLVYTVLGNPTNQTIEHFETYSSENARYLRIKMTVADPQGDLSMLCYVTNVNETLYMIIYSGQAGAPISESASAQVQALVDSIRFLGESDAGYQDIFLPCKDCGEEFLFTVADQLFYEEKGFQNFPSRCPDCRAARINATKAPTTTAAVSMHTIFCNGCGKLTQVPFEPRGDRPVYCSDCFRKLGS